MIALICGTGDLPGILARILMQGGARPVICALAGFPSEVPNELPRIDFRLEQLGSLLADLQARGVSRICMVGGVRRPVIDPSAVDAVTAPMIEALRAALVQGDDGTLRAIIGLIEAQGFQVVAPTDLAPGLLVRAGVLTRTQPDAEARAAIPAARAVLATMGRNESGQASVLREGRVIGREGPDGTDALLRSLPPGQGGFLFKGPKPGQDMRVDMPAIGPGTAGAAERAGLTGIAVVADGALLLHRAQVIAQLDAAGMWFWAIDADPVESDAKGDTGP